MLSNLICIVSNKALLPSLGMWPGRNLDRTLNKLSDPEKKTCYKTENGILRLVIVSGSRRKIVFLILFVIK